MIRNTIDYCVGKLLKQTMSLCLIINIYNLLFEISNLRSKVLKFRPTGSNDGHELVITMRHEGILL